MENNPGIGGEIFQIVLEDKWVDGETYFKNCQARMTSKISPNYVLKKIKGHKRVILTGYRFDAELL